MELKPTIHTRKEFSSIDDFSATPPSLVLAYYNKELGDRSYLTQEANIDELKVLVCAFLNRLGGRIYIGIDPESGKVKGIPVDDVDIIITDVYNACSKISPNPMIITPKVDVSYLPIMEEGSFTGKYILKVFVEQGEKSTIYSASRNDYYYRTEAGTNGKYTFAEYAQETERRLKGEFVHELVLFHDQVDRTAEDELNNTESFNPFTNCSTCSVRVNLNVPIYTFESSTLEYKRFRGIGDFPLDTNSNSATNKRTLTRTICAFLNTYGGRIYLGISDQRKIIGIDEKDVQEMKKQILTCLEEITPQVKEGLVQVDVIHIEDSKKKVLKIKVQPGELDKIYSLTTTQFGVYWRNGPSCQLYKTSHYRAELSHRIRKTFQRKKVVFSDDEVEEKEKKKLSECTRVLHHSLHSLQRDYLYKWETAYQLEGFSFPQEIKGIVEITLALQHLQSGFKEFDLALELFESGLESVLDFKRYQSLISVIAIYLLKNQHENAKKYYSEALLHVQKRENSSQLHENEDENHLYKEIFAQLASPQHVDSEAFSCLNLEILRLLTDLKQNSQIRQKPLKVIEGVVQDIVPGPRSSKLSIEDMKNEVMLSIINFPVTIVHGGTGSGKTTQLPQYLRQLFPTGRIALCQPYKESLDPILDRIREQVPDKKVFQITHKQHDMQAEEDGIFVMTHTTMLFQMLYDANFEQYRCIIIDEPHERLVDTDVLIAFMILMLKESKPLTPKFILSSATLDADHIIRVLGEVGKNMCNVLEINSARSYNVTNYDKSISFGPDPCKDNSDPEQAVRLIKQILDENYQNFNPLWTEYINIDIDEISIFKQ